MIEKMERVATLQEVSEKRSEKKLERISELEDQWREFDQRLAALQNASV